MRKALLSAALLFLFASSPVFAEVRTVSGLTIDVPDGWTLTEKGPKSVMVATPDKTRSVVVTIMPAQGTPEAYATALAKKLGAEDEPDYDEDGYYTFTYPGKDRSEILCVFAYDANEFSLFLITGEYDDTVENIMESVSSME